MTRIENILPLSSLQEGMLFHALSNPLDCEYSVQVTFDLVGHLDVGRLQAALDHMVRKHPALRTAFVFENVRKPRQVVLKERGIQLVRHDLTLMEPEERKTRVETSLDEERKRPFLLDEEPLLRMAVYQMTEDSFTIAATYHHIFADGWSLGVFWSELFSSYGAERGGETGLAESPFDWRSFHAASRKEDPAAREFWTRCLESFPGPTSIPDGGYDRSRGHAHRSHHDEVDAGLVEQVDCLARRCGVTPASAYLAAWVRVLQLHNDTDDVTFGNVVSGRNTDAPGIEEAIGLFINTVPLRVRLTATTDVAELLNVVQRKCREGDRASNLPLSEIKRINKYQGDYFDHVVAVENYPLDSENLNDRLRSTGLTVENICVWERSNYDLTLSINPGKAFRLVWNFNEARYPREVIVALGRQWVFFLRQMCESPRSTCAETPLFDAPPEIRNARRPKTPSSSEHSPCDTLAKSFERVAGQHADRIAVTCGSESISYRELDHRANRLARRLRNAGVKSDQLVGLLCDRSIDAIVGMLSIVKAGGAYLPIDPQDPASRLRYLIEDSGIALLVCNVDLNPEIGCVDLETIDLRRAEVSEGDSSAFPLGGSAKDLAYVIYTSGSTGRPKGVEVENGNVLRLLQAAEAHFDFDCSDVWTLFHSLSFDFSVWEIWGPLLSGARVAVVPYIISRDSEAFHRFLVEERVTVLNQTPSAFQLLSTVDGSLPLDQSPLALRYVIFGGEALDCRSLSGWVERHGLSRPALVNMYGITETTVHVTWHLVDDADVSGHAVARIGRPLDHLAVIIVDRYLREVPPGVRGQILVGGDGVARGYRSREELTRERFVFLAGNRFYCSGDVGSRFPDGSLQYRGRADRQVKIRGFRIELSEIEGNLYKLPGVRQAAVLMRQVDGSRNVLCAYLSTSQPLSVRAVRKGLAESLPAYMVPAHILILNELPLTLNGKVDYRALPDPTAPSDHESVVDSIPPRNEYETRLAEIWAEVLGRKAVGIREPFLALGGDSILSIQIVYRAKEAGIEFSIQELFTNPTIEELCSLVRNRDHADIPNSVATSPFSLIAESDVKKLPEGVVDAYPLCALQEGMFFHSDADPEAGVYTNVGSAALDLDLDENKLRQAIDLVVNRHPAIKASFHFQGYSVPLQIIHDRVQPELRVVDISAEEAAIQDHLIDTWIQEGRKQPIDREAAPLIRFQVHIRGPRQIQFSWVDYHAILDGWSLSALVGEIFQAYGQLLLAQPIRLPALPETSFRDYVALEGMTVKCESVLNFWREFGKVPGAYALPKRFGRERRRRGEVRIATATIEQAQEIRALASRLGLSPKSVFLAAHMRVLKELLNSDDVVTGLVTNGRLEVEGGEQVIGLFLNTIPFRMSISDQTWSGLIRQAGKAELSLLPYRRCPTSKIQQLNGGDRLFDTIFNYTDFYLYRKTAEAHGLDCVAPSQKVAPTNYPYVMDIDWDITGRLRLFVCYQEDWLSNVDAARVVGYYKTVIDRMLRHPDGRARAGILSANEKKKLTTDYNKTAGQLGQGATLGGLFAQAARAHPDRLAVVCDRFRWTYAELDRAADVLASTIIGRGEGEPENMIGILMDRSSLFVIAALAILKTGAAFVPIDPSWPDGRINYVIEDCHLSLVLTDRMGMSKAAESIAYFDIETCAFDHAVSEPPVAKGGPSNLAYTIYTSGSTGRPKGAMMEHEAVVNTLLDINKRHSVTCDDVILCVSSFCFDLSVYDIFGALSCGAKVVIARTATDGAGIWTQLIKRENVTIWNSVPALMGLLIRYVKEYSSEGALASLRVVMLSGDWIPVRLPDAIRECIQNVDIYSLGGATEAAIWSIHYPVKEVNPDWPSIPYGRPLRDQRYFVLNDEMEPCATNVPGSLYIGGRGLARGYCNLPERTADSFRASLQHGGRLYRTGDVGRYLDTGDLEFLGREDFQVKINGYRIELGEIEHALNRLDGVAGAVASVRGEEQTRSLCVHVSCDEALSDRDLRQWLAKELPDYMVPSIFIRVGEFPLSPNGKVDRKALLLLRGNDPVDVPYVAPDTEIGKVLEEIWKDGLGLDRVGLDSNYFALGGDSIVALRSIWKIRSRFEIDLSLEEFLGAQTLRNLEEIVLEKLLIRDSDEGDVQALLKAIETMPDNEVRERLASQ